jgi:hypothetical protein
MKTVGHCSQLRTIHGNRERRIGHFSISSLTSGLAPQKAKTIYLLIGKNLPRFCGAGSVCKTAHNSDMTVR